MPASPQLECKFNRAEVFQGCHILKGYKSVIYFKSLINENLSKNQNPRTDNSTGSW